MYGEVAPLSYLVLGLRMHGNIPLLFMYFMGWSLCMGSFVIEADNTSKF